MKLPVVLILFVLSFKVTAQTVSSDTLATAADYKKAVPVHSKNKGYMGMVEMGLLAGKNTIDDSWLGPNSGYYITTSFTIQAFNGYRFGRALAVGITTGLDGYQNIVLAPIALGLRGELLDTRISPFYSLDLGYGFDVRNREGNIRIDGGLLFNPAIGMRVKTGNNTAFSFGLGYKTQKAFHEVATPWSTTSQTMLMRRVSVRTGFMF